MQIDAQRETLHVHVGATFGARDLAKVQEAVAALGPFARLDFDFAAVRQCDDAALARLACELMLVERGEVRLRGLTRDQWCLLTLLKFAHDGG